MWFINETAYYRKKSRSYFARESSSIIEAPGAQVSEGLSSSVFEIQTVANIPADKSGHKVCQFLVIIICVCCLGYNYGEGQFHVGYGLG